MYNDCFEDVRNSFVFIKKEGFSVFTLGMFLMEECRVRGIYFNIVEFYL